MRVVLLLTCGVLALAVRAAAQSHEPAAPSAKAAPAGSNAAVSHAATDDHAPVPGAKGEKPARPTPVVSRVSAAPRAVAVDSEPDARDQAPGPGATRKGGYVATGARKGEARAAQGSPGKTKPVVSGAEVLGRQESAADANGVAPVAEHRVTTVAPAAGATKGTTAPAAVDAHAGTPGAPTSRVPVKLADVHSRLAAALAEAREESLPSKGSLPSKDGAADDPAGERAPAQTAPAGADVFRTAKAPRLAVQWPPPRWRLRWPALDRLAVTWPSVAPAPSPLPNRPTPY